MGVPIARSDPRRATIIGIVGVVVGTLMILAVLFAGSLDGDSSHTTSSRAKFDVGPAKDRAAAIDRDQTPLIFPDTATGANPIVVQHTGSDPKTGWSAFAATSDDRGQCAVTWHRESHDFSDCKGTRFPADGEGLHPYPTKIDNNDLIVDLDPDASSTSS